MSEFSDSLKRIRTEKGFSQGEIAEKVGIAKSTYSLYENGKRKPDIEKIKKIIKALETTSNELLNTNIADTDTYSEFEIKLIQKYRDLDQHGKEMVDSALSIELKRMENERKKPPTVIKINDTEKHSIKLPYYDLPASAGTGEYLDEYNHFEYIYVPESENALRANYVMRVSGDSMEPKYYEGDKLLVKYTEAIDPGQIGIFVVNNERYVKKCGNGRLISLNPGYEDIIIGEFDEVRCEGKVIGKL